MKPNLKLVKPVAKPRRKTAKPLLSRQTFVDTSIVAAGVLLADLIIAIITKLASFL